MGRRGLGASLDGPGCSAEREFRDVTRVVRAVAGWVGEQVGCSDTSGGQLCLGAAALDASSLLALVENEPSLGLHYPPGLIDRVEGRVGAGGHEGAVIQVLDELGSMTEEQVAAVRAAPVWPDRVAAAPTIAREARIEDSRALSAEQSHGINVPTLVLAGSRTRPRLPDGRLRRFLGLSSGCSKVTTISRFGLEPAVVAEALLEWSR